MYPVNLDLRGVFVLVVGGGAVAERKVRRLLEAGADVTLLTPVATEGLEALAEEGRIEWICRRVEENDTRPYRLVFAVTNDREVNARVADEAKRFGIWVNVGDAPEESTFHVPSSIRRGALTISISTGGASPLLARRIREELEARYDEAYGTLLELLEEARKKAARRLPTQLARRRFYEAVLNSDVLDFIRRGERSRAEEHIEELLNAHRKETSA